MKRLPAILFLFILLFNFYGYRLVIHYLQDRQASLLQSRLDQEQYDDQELISIKTPMDLPYYTNSNVYERAYGSAEINGVAYEYVKRRVYHDTLELLCVPNTVKMQLRSAANAFFQLSLNDVYAQQGKKSVPTIKIGLPDFFQELTVFSMKALSKIPTHYISSSTRFLKNDYSSTCDHPPESMHWLS